MARFPGFRPDAKSQVTIEYDGFTPIRVDTVVVSTQHSPDVSHAEIKKTIHRASDPTRFCQPIC